VFTRTVSTRAALIAPPIARPITPPVLRAIARPFTALTFAAGVAACAPSDPLADWSDGALCGDGAITDGPPLVPRPRTVTHAGAPITLGRATMTVAGAGFAETAPSKVAPAEGAPSEGAASEGAASEGAASEGAASVPALARVARAAGLTLGSAAIGGLHVTVLDGAGLDAISARCGATLPAGDEAYALAIRPTPDGSADAIIAARTRRGASRAAALLAERFDASGALHPIVAFDAPATALRGILEGFYGPAWRDDERHTMLDFAWRMRMNVLVWGPKSDFGLRIFWRGELPPETIAHVRALAAEAEAIDIELCATLSPGNGFLYSDADERARLEDKLDALVALGVSCLSIAFDDIPRELRPEDEARYPGGLGEAQADLVGALFPRLAAKHPDVRLGFTPTDYSTAAMDEHPEDTRALAAALPREVLLGWTGNEIVAPTVTKADVDRVTALWGRPPLMGDNYPVSDSARDVGRLQLGPVTGRDADAITATEGWLTNTLCLPRASMIAVATIADQLWDPARYEEGDAWARSLARAGGAHADALAFFAEHARSSALAPDEARALDRLTRAWSEAFPADSPALAAHLARMAGIEAELRPLGALGDELAPWAAQLAAYGRAGTTALALTARVRSGETIPAAELDAFVAEVSRLEASDVVVARPVAERFLADARAHLGR
jgi:hyaluronoglucosaminidase